MRVKTTRTPTPQPVKDILLLAQFTGDDTHTPDMPDADSLRGWHELPECVQFWANRLGSLLEAQARAESIESTEAQREIMAQALARAIERAEQILSLAQAALEERDGRAEISARAEKAFLAMADAHGKQLDELQVTLGYDPAPVSAAEHLKTLAVEFSSEWEYDADLDAVFGDGFKYASFFSEDKDDD